MINISLAGLIGAVGGTVFAAVIYYLVIGVLERRFRERERRMPPEELANTDLTLSTMRRLVLTVDLVLFAGVGYWLGSMVGG
jgi:hypothetical protein